mgnify:CR=1 FL=1
MKNNYEMINDEDRWDALFRARFLGVRENAGLFNYLINECIVNKK